MNHTVVKTSEIASHPYLSMGGPDYIASEKHVKQLLSRYNTKDKSILTWMMSTGRVSFETMVRYVGEIQTLQKEQAERRIAKLMQNLSNLIGE